MAEGNSNTYQRNVFCTQYYPNNANLMSAQSRTNQKVNLKENFQHPKENVQDNYYYKSILKGNNMNEKRLVSKNVQFKYEPIVDTTVQEFKNTPQVLTANSDKLNQQMIMLDQMMNLTFAGNFNVLKDECEGQNKYSNDNLSLNYNQIVQQPKNVLVNLRDCVYQDQMKENLNPCYTAQIEQIQNLLEKDNISQKMIDPKSQKIGNQMQNDTLLKNQKKSEQQAYVQRITNRQNQSNELYDIKGQTPQPSQRKYDQSKQILPQRQKSISREEKTMNNQQLIYNLKFLKRRRKSTQQERQSMNSIAHPIIVLRPKMPNFNDPNIFDYHDNIRIPQNNFQTLHKYSEQVNNKKKIQSRRVQ